jgi:hypothetical protein
MVGHASAEACGGFAQQSIALGDGLSVFAIVRL